MRKILSILLLIQICSVSAFATDYFFLANEDHFYENPSNWYPAYPGTHVKAADRIVILTDVNYTGFDLEVDGIMEVMLGAKITSADGAITIHKQGELDNDGELLVASIFNYGKLNNRFSAVVHVHDFVAYNGAFTHNAYSASFRTINNLTNEGRFDNYSSCFAGRDFRNEAVFNQNRHSLLDVSGELVMAPGSTLTQSRQSSIYQGMSNKIPLHEKLAEK